MRCSVWLLFLLVPLLACGGGTDEDEGADGEDSSWEPEEERSPDSSFDDPPESYSCCRVCRTGKACGDSCIAVNRTCRVGLGCACNG